MGVFCVLTDPEPAREGMIGRLLDKMIRRRPVMTERRVLGSAFWQMTAFAPMDARTWRMIEQAAGEYCTDMVSAEGLEPPEGCAVVPFSGEERFAPLLTANTAAAVIGASGLPRARRVAGIVDPRGVWQRLILRMIPACAAVTVLTDAPWRYERFCEQVFERYGAPILLCAPDSDLGGCAVVAAPEGLTVRQCSQIAAPVLSARGTAAPTRIPQTTALAIAPSGELAAALPAGVDATRFAAALFELGRVSALENSVAAFGRQEGQRVSLDTLVRQITRYGGNSP